MKNYSQIAAWVVFIPGVNQLAKYDEYAQAWRASQKILAHTGRVALVEPIYA